MKTGFAMFYRSQDKARWIGRDGNLYGVLFISCVKCGVQDQSVLIRLHSGFFGCFKSAHAGSPDL